MSNQSFDKPKVDISITIDGNRIIADTFRVKDQHCWEEYSLNLPAGSHRLKAQVDDGAYELETEFDTEGKHWAVVSFWFKEGKKGKTSYPPRITFEISDTPVMFL
ncbi:MAG: hypothetical protein GY851_11845 [bacterium]|nr:hypothetical protein [bacterium]